MRTEGKINVLQIRSSQGAGGGPEKTILNTARQIDPQDFTMPVVYLRSVKDPYFDIDRRAEELGIGDFTAIKERFKLDTRALRQLLAILRSRRIHILHSHCYKSDLYGLLLARRYSMKLVTTAHGPFAAGNVVWSAGNWKVRYLYDRIDLRLLRYFDRVLMVTETMKPLLTRYRVPENKQMVLHNAIDTSYFQRTPKTGGARAELGISQETFLLGAVGRLNPEKDYPTLLEAAKVLSDRRHSVTLAIAGEGPEKGNLTDQISRLGLEDSVLLLGHLRDIRDFYCALDGYVLSSTREGLPNTILEAMAMEVPIVATDVDGVREAVRHGQEALLARPGDPEALADTIQDLMSGRDKRDQLRQSARRRVQIEFSFRKRVQVLENIYRDVLYR